MKFLCPIFCIFSVLGSCAVAADFVDEKKLNNVYEWSFAALSDSMKRMRNGCEDTNGDEFIEVSNWARSKNGHFSIAELVAKCESVPKFKELYRGAIDKTTGLEKACELPNASACVYNESSSFPINCGEKTWTKPTEYGASSILGCDIFVSMVIKKNNEIANTLGTERGPGTYVKRIDYDVHGPTYQIIDVILSDDYYANDRYTINFDANTDDKNTMIYEVFDNGLITPLLSASGEALHTWTNDMFLDVRPEWRLDLRGFDRRGRMAGVMVKAFIMPSNDVTYRIYDIYNTNRGLYGASVTNAILSYTGNPYDIKTKLGPEFKITTRPFSQLESESHGNGLMFKGKVATIDWLGNLLYSMNSDENKYGEGGRLLAGAAADVVSSISTWGEERKLSVEPETVQQAFMVGKQLVAELRNGRDDRFNKTQTHKESEAYAMAKQVMETAADDNGYGAHRVVCTGNCNPRIGTQDIVSCTGYDDNNVFFVQDFVFDDICDKSIGQHILPFGTTPQSYSKGQAGYSGR